MYLYFDVTESLLFPKTTRIRENAGKFIERDWLPLTKVERDRFVTAK